jgi:hypothetical protein
MSVIVDGEEFYSVPEACEYLGGISSQTLRLRARANGVQAYRQGISRNVYYKKSDLDRMKAFRPVNPGEDNE